MIRFEDFVGSIHDAILSANEALVDRNLDLLERFFDQSDEDPELRKTLDGVVDATNRVLEERRPTKGSLRKVVKAVEEVRQALSDGTDVGAKLGSDPHRSLRPKMATIQYPEQTADGLVLCEVQVPLITLVPLSMTQVSEVKLRSNLQIEIENDAVVVSFPMAGTHPASSSPSGPREESPEASPETLASLEITLTPHTGTEGLKRLVRGYERALRAQIPT